MFCFQWIQFWCYKPLGTSVIYNPLSPPSLIPPQICYEWLFLSCNELNGNFPGREHWTVNYNSHQVLETIYLTCWIKSFCTLLSTAIIPSPLAYFLYDFKILQEFFVFFLLLYVRSRFVLGLHNNILFTRFIAGFLRRKSYMHALS